MNAGLLLALALLLALGCAFLYVAFTHNLAIFLVTAAVMGAAPAAQLPVVQVSVLFLAALSTWVAVATSPRPLPQPDAVTGLVLVLVGVSTAALVAHPLSGDSISDYLRWLAVTAMVYPLQTLSTPELHRVGRWFVGGAVLAAAIGLWARFVDPAGLSSPLLGLDAQRPERVVVNPDGSTTTRLTATYVDPNLAAVVLGIALLVAIVVLRGRVRVFVVLLVGVAVLLTLSRSVWGSAAVAGVLLVLASRLAPAARARLAAAGAVIAVVALSVASIRERLLNSFGTSDIGSQARGDALAQVMPLMEGHWLFGVGFGAPEITDPVIAATNNFAANAPLVALYRGGIVVGLVFTALLLVTAVRASGALRSATPERAVLGAGCLGLLAVAFQLDFTVVSLSPATAAFSLLLALLRPEANALHRSADDVRVVP